MATKKVAKKECKTASKVLGSAGGRITAGKKPKSSKKTRIGAASTMGKCSVASPNHYTPKTTKAKKSSKKK